MSRWTPPGSRRPPDSVGNTGSSRRTSTMNLLRSIDSAPARQWEQSLAGTGLGLFAQQPFAPGADNGVRHLDRARLEVHLTPTERWTSDARSLADSDARGAHERRQVRQVLPNRNRVGRPLGEPWAALILGQGPGLRAAQLEPSNLAQPGWRSGRRTGPPVPGCRHRRRRAGRIGDRFQAASPARWFALLVPKARRVIA